MGQAVISTRTYTGNPASFIGGADDTITALSVQITPTQNLNGYSKPWAAGGGKNKLNNILDTTTVRNVTFTTQPDGSVLAVSTTPPESTAYADIMPSGFSLPEGTYILSGCPAGGVNSSYDLRIKITTNGTSQTKYDYGSGVEFTIQSGTVIDSVRVVIRTNYDASAGVTFWPMIRLASVADDSYEPYSNICPITGRTGLSVYVSPTQDVADATTYAVDWTSAAGTVYGGTVSLVTGNLNSTMANIASYNGETIGEPWLSSMDEFVSGTTPTTGAQVVYTLATPITYTLTAPAVALLTGQNYLWSDVGNSISITITAPTRGFAGWLIKVVNNGTPVEIPLKYMRAETYTVTPDQRMEWSAERDVTGVLHRETVANMPPKIEFTTPLMTNSDIYALNTIIQSAFTNVLGRDITVQFYDPEKNEYWQWDCYMPDVHYSIRNVDIVNNIINYEELRYAFIGY